MGRLTIEIKKDENKNIWVTSDTHYGHKNICRGVTEWRTVDNKIPITQTRDFPTIDKMNDTIVKNINSVVNQNDILIHGGDWSFGGIENIWNFYNRLNCKNIYLILGNHDHHIERDKILPNCHVNIKNLDELELIDEPPNNVFNDGRDDLFKIGAKELFLEVFDKLILTVKNRELERKDVIYFDHYPISSWENLNKGVCHLHGHSHLPHNKKFSMGRRMDVGIDGHIEFRPYELYRECLNPLYKLEVKSDLMKLDHHTERLNNSQ